MAASSHRATDPPPPTAEELAAIGVETNVEPGRARFKETKLQGQPPSDRKLVLDSGLALRERVRRVPITQDAVSAGPVADSGFNLVITHALLTPDGEVAKGPDGSFRVKTGSHQHEVNFTAAALGIMTDAEIENELLRQREVAAHGAELFFAGIEKGDRLFGPRLVPPPTQTKTEGGEG